MPSSDVINAEDFVNPESSSTPVNTSSENAFDRFRSNASSVASVGKGVVTGASAGQPGSVLILMMLLLFVMQMGLGGTTLVLIMAMALMFIL